MATYLELQTRVQRLVIDLPAAVTTEVPTLINEVIKAIQDEHNFRVMEALSADNLTTLSTRVLMAVPSNFKELRDDPYVTPELGKYKHITVAADRSAVLEEYTATDTGEPKVLLRSEPSDELGASNWEVWPLPDGNSDYDDGEYRVSIPYWRYLTELSADGDTNWFTVKAEEYIIEAAAARAFGLDWDAENMGAHLQLADMHKRRIIKADKMLRAAAVTTLVPHFQGENTPKLRRL